MSLITKEHDYLICFDSDGTIMDTMTIKHVECFGPAFIKVFGISVGKREILDHWAEVNLYSKHRGQNRFVGLAEIIDYSKQFGYKYCGEEEFDNWVNSTTRYSVDAIKEIYNPDDVESVMYKAVVWSQEVNKMVNALPMAKPFENVCEIVKKLYTKADLVGVSSAPKEAVCAEWKAVHIYDYFKLIACQDFGKKADIIRLLTECGYDKDKIIMLGDAMGDKSAADKNGVKFYPLIPREESACWERFRKESCDRFFNGEYDADYQTLLEKRFFEVLK